MATSSATPFRREREGWLQCKVSRGPFASERTILLDLPDGQFFSIVDRGDVRTVAEPKEAGDEVPGEVHVVVVEIRRDALVIDLPRETFVSGARFVIPTSFPGYTRV